jgi:hypothetical protein
MRRALEWKCFRWLEIWNNKKNCLKINLTFLTVNRMNSWFLYRPCVYNVSQIIYSSTTWIDGRVLDSIINKFNQMNLQNGQSEHLFIDQLSVSLSVNKMSPSRMEFSACMAVKPVIIRYFWGLLFQIQALRADVSLFHIMVPANVTTHKLIFLKRIKLWTLCHWEREVF